MKYVIVCILVAMSYSVANADNSNVNTGHCDLTRDPRNYADPTQKRCVIHTAPNAPEMSSATYRVMALDAYKKGNYARECAYLKKAVNAREAAVPAKKSGSLSHDCRWDYNAETAAQYRSDKFNGIWCPGKGPGNQTCQPY